MTTPLQVMAQAVESLRPPTAPPGWACIAGDEQLWNDGMDSLLDFVAPADVSVIVIVGHGTATGLSGPSDNPRVLAPGAKQRIKVVVAVSRTGEVAGYLRAESGAVLVSDAPSDGRLYQAARRAFGLYASQAARDARDSGYGKRNYWTYLDLHALQLHDHFMAQGDKERAELMLTQSLGEALAGNDGD